MGKTKTLSVQDRIDLDVKDIIAKGKETQFLSVGVPYVDGTYEEDHFVVAPETMNNIAQRVTQKCPELSFMIIAATCHYAPHPNPMLIAYVHSAGSVDADKWMLASGLERANNPLHHGFLYCEYPLKEKDLVINKSCNFLRAQGLIHDEEEEMVPFDINAD